MPEAVEFDDDPSVTGVVLAVTARGRTDCWRLRRAFYFLCMLPSPLMHFGGSRKIFLGEFSIGGRLLRPFLVAAPLS